MAKKGGNSKGYISTGTYKTVSKKIRNAIRKEYLSSGEREINQLKALKAGKDIVVTIENPNKEETNKRFIRKRISGKEYVDSMKKNNYRMKGETTE